MCALILALVVVATLVLSSQHLFHLLDSVRQALYALAGLFVERPVLLLAFLGAVEDRVASATFLRRQRSTLDGVTRTNHTLGAHVKKMTTRAMCYV